MFPRRHARETIFAFKKIAKEFPELKLVMVGKDKYLQSNIEAMIRKVNEELGSDRIVHYDYLENREDIDKLYAGAAALIYVSDREAFGLPPMEALAFGVPPVISDNKLGHELFEEYAFYSKDGSTDAIADAMRQALTESEKINKIKNLGSEFVSKYNWKNFADKFFKEIQR
jgi:glycosyltransferase involved in cell wall biosynthesis